MAQGSLAFPVSQARLGFPVIRASRADRGALATPVFLVRASQGSRDSAATLAFLDRRDIQALVGPVGILVSLALLAIRDTRASLGTAVFPV